MSQYVSWPANRSGSGGGGSITPGTTPIVGGNNGGVFYQSSGTITNNSLFTYDGNNLNVTAGTLTADAFVGDGAGLTGIQITEGQTYSGGFSTGLLYNAAGNVRTSSDLTWNGANFAAPSINSENVTASIAVRTPVIQDSDNLDAVRTDIGTRQLVGNDGATVVLDWTDGNVSIPSGTISSNGNPFKLIVINNLLSMGDTDMGGTGTRLNIDSGAATIDGFTNVFDIKSNSSSNAFFSIDTTTNTGWWGDKIGDVNSHYIELDNGSAQTHFSSLGILADGDITATNFIGNGSGLTGLPNPFDQDLNIGSAVKFNSVSDLSTIAGTDNGFGGYNAITHYGILTSGNGGIDLAGYSVLGANGFYDGSNQLSMNLNGRVAYQPDGIAPAFDWGTTPGTTAFNTIVTAPMGRFTSNPETEGTPLIVKSTSGGGFPAFVVTDPTDTAVFTVLDDGEVEFTQAIGTPSSVSAGTYLAAPYLTLAKTISSSYSTPVELEKFNLRGATTSTPVAGMGYYRNNTIETVDGVDRTAFKELYTWINASAANWNGRASFIVGNFAADHELLRLDGDLKATLGDVAGAGNSTTLAINDGTSSITLSKAPTVTPFSTAGLVHNNSSGVLSSSTLVNADVNASAAIAYSKLASMSTGQVLLGNAGTPTATTLSGDVTVGATGVTAIGTNKVTNAMLAQAPTLTIKGNNTGGTANELDLTVAQVNTMLGSLSNPMTTGGDIIYGGASGVATRLANGSAGSILQSAGGTSAPAWSTPTFPTTAGTSGNIIKSNGTNYTVGAIDLSSPGGTFVNQLAISAGGTGQSSAASALTALLPVQSGNANKFLTTNATSASWSLVPLSTGVSGTLDAAQFPALTGDVTTSAGSLATTLAATSNATLVSLDKSTGVTIHGTNTNNSAANGYYGEYQESVVSTTASVASTGTFGDITSFTLSAGDWDISGLWYIDGNGGVVTNLEIMITSTSGNSTTGMVVGSNYTAIPTPRVGDGCGGSIPGYRVSLTGNTTYYLKLKVNYTVATPKAGGRISARRMR